MGVSSSKSTSENPQVVAARRRELLVSAVNREQIHNPEDVKIDYLMVAMTWPSLFACASVNKGQTDICREKIVTSDFSLHGVWPSVNSGAIFECTFGENFDFGKIARLEPKLNQHWHDYKIQNPGSHFLYSHEWSAHGKCATVLPEFDSQFKYFDSALNIFSHIPLLKALEQNGIEPGQQVDKQVFKEALASAGIKNSILQCYKNALVEIRTCVTKEPTGENNQHDFIVCPNVRGDSCASSFLFPDPKNDYDDMDF